VGQSQKEFLLIVPLDGKAEIYPTPGKVLWDDDGRCFLREPIATGGDPNLVESSVREQSAVNLVVKFHIG
jgi:hypothetical protein